ncbi:MAG: ATP-dependent DNA ligase [Austwickia sp.]|nr:ATP-dependent DNA ligase [Austwickia sp.]
MPPLAELPLELPIAPMLAKAVTTIPAADSVPGGLAYEPKWDGFRAIVLRGGDDIELCSRGGKSLNRYFPEVIQALARLLPPVCALDGEIVVRSGPPGAQRLDWDALSQRIHPADSRVQLLAQQTPAEFIAFDLLAIGGEDLTGAPLQVRRQRLELALAHLRLENPVHVSALTQDAELAGQWFDRFEGAGLDGVIAKPWAGPYTPGKRTLLKIKHRRTADAVVTGYRVHTSGQGVGSLLLGVYADNGHLMNVGGIAAFTQVRRRELIEELAPLVVRDEAGQALHAETDRSRFSANKDVSYVPLRPERVVEVAFDQLEGYRFRHAVTFLRWRPDKDPTECRYDQIDRATAYDLAKVLHTG